MDGLITIVVLVIVFNILNRLVGAAKRKQQSQPRRSFRIERPVPERSIEKSVDDPSFFHISWPEGSNDSYTGDEEDYEQEIEKLPDTGKKRAKSLAADKKATLKSAADPASNNLRNLLNNKDSLVAAFIFHEAISKPPLSRRGKRTTSNRYR